MRVVRVTPENAGRWLPQIVQLEALARYPLGDDSFRIDHGSDYFAFFTRLGELYYYAAVEGDEVLAVAAGVLRTQPFRAWYGCDLKVHPSHRGRHLPLRMLTRVFLQRYVQCARAYGISMNTPGTPNRMRRLVAHFPWRRADEGPGLLLYSLDADHMRAAEPALRRHRGELGYLSLRGRKDLVLTSTGAPLPLLHVQFGSAAEHGGPREPQAGHTHMLCAPTGDPLHADLAALGLFPSASATLLHHRMGGSDWRHVLTSDI